LVEAIARCDKEKHYLIDYLANDLELVFVELPKFQQPLEQLSTITEKAIQALHQQSAE